MKNARLLLSLLLQVVCSLEEKQRELRLLGLLPMSGEGWTGGGSCLPAIQMAVEDIQLRPDLLSDYNLTYKWIDSKCSFGTPVYRMFDAFHNDPPFVMLLGDGCSIGSEATAQVSHLWNLTQFSYGSSSPILSDRNRFPNFFRIVVPDQKMNIGRIAMLKEFNWKKVATVHQALEFFSVVVDDFVQRIQKTDISILSQEIFVNDPLNRIRNLKKHDARIIMTSLYEDRARAVLCAAFKVGLYGPKIVWVFAGWFSTKFWRVNLNDVDCTEGEMDKAAEGAFLTGPVFKNPVEEKGIAEMTASEFEKRYYSYPTYSPENKDTDFAAHQCYDHIWIAALALNCTDAILKDLGHAKSLDMFTYQDADINDIIFDCMTKTNITGVSGRIVLSYASDPDRLIRIERIQGGERRIVGMYRQDKDPTYFDWIEDAILWKDGNVPRDSALIIEQERRIPTDLLAVMASLSGLGICFSVVFFIFNVVYRNNKIVRLSSPNINNILLLGCVLCYCTVFFKISEMDKAVICKASIFCFSLGFTVTFGSLFSKTWRVYRIYTNKKLLKRAIKDYQLIVVIGGLAAVQLLVLIIWETIDPHHIVTRFLLNEVIVTYPGYYMGPGAKYIQEFHPPLSTSTQRKTLIDGTNINVKVFVMKNGAEVRPFVSTCVSEYSLYFEWALCITHGVLLTFGAFLAWETRKVKIEALNDSHEIGLCIYNVVVLSAIGLIMLVLLKDRDTLVYGITSGCLLVGTTVTEIVIFMPKIHAIRTKVAETITLPNMPGSTKQTRTSQPTS